MPVRWDPVVQAKLKISALFGSVSMSLPADEEGDSLESCNARTRRRLS